MIVGVNIIEYIKYYKNHSIEDFYNNYDSLNENIKSMHETLTNYLPEDFFLEMIDLAIKSETKLNFLRTLNKNVKDSNGLINQGLVHISSLENNINGIDMKNVYSNLAFTFKINPMLLEIRHEHIKYLNNKNKHRRIRD